MPKITDQRWVRRFIKNVGRQKFTKASLMAQKGKSASEISEKVELPLSYAKIMLEKTQNSVVAK
jgi:hypothetical protein